ncbi:hypothetical protein R3I94_008776 [Phoxinus phoxinus]
MYSSKFRSLRPLTYVPEGLKPQPPNERNPGGIVTMRELAHQNRITSREKSSVSSRPQSLQLPPIFGPSRAREQCPHISLAPFKVIDRAHQPFDKARTQRSLAEKVTEHHTGRRHDFLEARRTDVRLRQDREVPDMERTPTRQRAKQEQDAHHARHKYAQFLEEKRRRIQEQEMVSSFSQQHNSLGRAVFRYNTWRRENGLQ